MFPLYKKDPIRSIIARSFRSKNSNVYFDARTVKAFGVPLSKYRSLSRREFERLPSQVTRKAFDSEGKQTHALFAYPCPYSTYEVLKMQSIESGEIQSLSSEYYKKDLPSSRFYDIE